jgi:methyl-accepting chemotaxis protein
VTHSSSVASECVGAIDSISQTIRDISVVATTIASAVEEQGSATRDRAQRAAGGGRHQ